MSRKGLKLNGLRLGGNDRGQARSLDRGLFLSGRGSLVWRQRISDDAIEVCGIRPVRLLRVWISEGLTQADS